MKPNGGVRSDAAVMVDEFHQTYGLPVRTTPSLDVGFRLQELRKSLMREELAEVCAAIDRGDLIEVADGLADLLYVVYGTALTFGIDLDAVVREVHRSNMTKLGPDGRPIYREDGKVMKGPGFELPRIAEVLNLADKGG
ncbi:MAG: pyrophosphohydrolase domain-containing protein [Candidatus Dormibacteria bacterium]